MLNNKFHFEFKKKTLKNYDFFPYTFIFLFPKIYHFLFFFHPNKSKTPQFKNK